MKLLYDKYADWWVWVEENNHDIELSPSFDDEESARLWRTRMINILVKSKNDIQQS
jgi:hypothetical protein